MYTFSQLVTQYARQTNFNVTNQNYASLTHGNVTVIMTVQTKVMKVAVVSVYNIYKQNALFF